MSIRAFAAFLVMLFARITLAAIPIVAPSSPPANGQVLVFQNNLWVPTTITAASNVSANTIFAGPASALSPPAAATFRSLVAADLPIFTRGTGAVAGAVPGAGGPLPGTEDRFLRADATWVSVNAITVLPSITGNANKVLTNNGTDTISWTTAGSGGGVSSVALSLPNIFTVSGSPVTTSGTLTGTLANESANLVFVGPGTGSPAPPTFRALTSADLPNIPIAGGGTGQTSANAAFNALAPSQASNVAKYLASNGTNSSWHLQDNAFNFRTDLSQKWRLALGSFRNSDRDIKILFLGESTIAGRGDMSFTSSGIANTDSVVGKFTQFVNNSFAASAFGLGIPGSHIDGYSDARWTIGSQWSSLGFGAASGATYGWSGTGSGAAATLSYSPDGGSTYDRFDVYYTTGPSNGTLTITATGGTPVVVNSNSSTLGWNKTTVSAASALTNNTITIVGSANPIYIGGVEPWNSSIKRIRIGNMGVSGALAANWTQDATYGGIPLIKAYAPDIVIIEDLINDCAASTTPSSVVTNLTAIVTAARVSGDAIIMTCPPSSLTQGLPAFTNEPAMVAAVDVYCFDNGVPCYDLFNRWNATYQASLMSSGGEGIFHTNNEGNYDWAGGLYYNFKQLADGGRSYSFSDISGTVGIGAGGTGQTTATTGFNALAPSQASANGQFLTSNGTNASWASITIPTAANPTATINTTATNGTATTFMRSDAAPAISASYAGQTSITTLGTVTTGTWNGTSIAIANGGTGQATASAAFNALSPNTTTGDISYYGSATNSRLAGNTSSTKNFLTQTGTGSASAAPVWGTIAAGDLPNHSTALLTSGQLALARGGTNADLSATGGASQVLKQASSGATITVGQLAFTDVSGTLGIGAGGTGQVTANAALNAFMPTQTSNSGKYLTTDGTNTSWGTVSSGGTGANPTASVGLTVKNGSATTFLRSDGASALDVSITPTWTGSHTFNAASNFVGNVTVPHLIGGTTTPATNAFSGAGTSPTLSITGSDLSCKVTLTTGTLPSLSATVLTVTFTSAYASAPNVQMTAGNSNASALSGVSMVYPTTSSSAMTLTANTTALAAATQYVWYFTFSQ